MDILKTLMNEVEDGYSCVLATVVEKKGNGPVTVGGKLILTSDDRRIGTVGGGPIEARVIEVAGEIMTEGKNQLRAYDITGEGTIPDAEKLPMICGGVIRVFYEVYQPKPNLFVFGLGHVGKEILRKVDQVGFKVHGVDLLQPEMEPFDQFYDSVQDAVENGMDKDDYAIICTGDGNIDYEIMKRITLKGDQLKYLGLLASGKKRKGLLEKLNGETGKTIEKLYSPIGINTGGRTPAEIAISIVSEIQMVRYGIKHTEELTKE